MVRGGWTQYSPHSSRSTSQPKHAVSPSTPTSSKLYFHATSPTPHTPPPPRLLFSKSRRKKKKTTTTKMKIKPTSTRRSNLLRYSFLLITLLGLVRLWQVNLQATMLLDEHKAEQDIRDENKDVDRLSQSQNESPTSPSLEYSSMTTTTTTALSTASSSSNNNKTLTTSSVTLALLYPTGMIGGYANQVIRFIGLVDWAVENNYSSLYLPSLWWSTRVHDDRNRVPYQEYPLPMDQVFDIDYWNQHRGVGARELPRIVTHLSSKKVEPDCWTTLKQTRSDGNNNNLKWLHEHLSNSSNPVAQAASVWPIQPMLQHYGYNPRLFQETVAMMASILKNPRRRDYLDRVRSDDIEEGKSLATNATQVPSCQNPAFYGGGTHSGRLWKQMMVKYRQMKLEMASPQLQQPVTPSMDEAVRVALVPAPQWRRAAEQCVVQRLNLTNFHNHYVALHARLEMDMLTHHCGKQMENRLQSIFSQIQSFLSNHNQTEEGLDMQGLLVMVGRTNLVSRKGYLDGRAARKFQSIAQGNQDTLDAYVNGTGYATDKRLEISSSQGIPVFGCGADALRGHYALSSKVQSSSAQRQMTKGEAEQHDNQSSIQPHNHGSLVEAVLNYHLAVRAKLFVGTKGSSFSSHIWRTRSLLGKGAWNFEYIKDGHTLRPLEGWVDPHMDCDGKW